MTERGTTVKDAARDFDFWMGKWRVENKRLMKRLAGCTEWEEFTATCRAWPLPGGIGNYDEFVPDTWRPGFVGMSLRIFNPDTKLWSIYWVDNKVGILQPPVVGGFENGIGIFEGPDEFDGKPIVVRFTWSGISAKSACWEQVFSVDEGKTWETNWVMMISRMPE
ncbi:MAG: hypothetical protein AAB011_08280 [Candidatus Eisenbacteria bacterium]